MSNVTIATGAVWGIAGAIAMVVVMRVRGGRDPPPFAVFWSKYVGDRNPAKAMPQALSLHLVYAAVAGALYAAVFSAVDLGFPITGYVGGVLWGVVWAVILFVVGAMFWMNVVLDVDVGGDQKLTLALAHLAFGLVLGILGATAPHVL